MQTSKNHKFNFFKKEVQQHKLPYEVLIYIIAVIALICSPLSIYTYSTIISASSYCLGIFYGVKGLFALKQSNENKEYQLKYPIIFMVLSALLMALPTLLSVGVDTVW